MLYNIWVTRACNLKCDYCYEGMEKKSDYFPIEMTDAFVRFIINTGGIKKRHWINFHGGEPLLNFNGILEIVKKLEQCEVFCSYSLTTNGTRFTPEILEFIERHHVDTTISIDGDRETHDHFRKSADGSGSYTAAVQGMKSLIKRNIPVRIRLTFHSQTVSKLLHNIQHILGLGGKTVIAAPDVFDSGWVDGDMLILERQLNLLNDYYHNSIEKQEPEIFISMTHKEEFKKLGICRGGFNEFNIDCDGSIYPCVYTVADRLFRIGDLKQGINQTALDRLSREYEKKNGECEDCGHADRCVACRCKFLNHALTGGFCTPSPVICSIEHAKIKSILKTAE